MDLNFREALAALARAFPSYLFYAAALVLGGLLILLEFGLALFALHLARITAPAAAPILAALILLGGWLTVLAWQRLFLYRHQAAMLVLFAGAAPSLASAEARRMFPAHSNWARWNRRLRQALFGLGRGRELEAAPAAGIWGRLAESVFSPAVFTLAFAHRGDPELAIREGLALYWRHGAQTRCLSRRWLRFSAAGFALLFLCMVLANAFIFHQAGAPIVIGVALALVIAWALHQAFLAPLALAGVSAALLSETRGCEPDPALCEKLAPLFTP